MKAVIILFVVLSKFQERPHTLAIFVENLSPFSSPTTNTCFTILMINPTTVHNAEEHSRSYPRYRLQHLYVIDLSLALLGSDFDKNCVENIIKMFALLFCKHNVTATDVICCLIIYANPCYQGIPVLG